MLFLLHTRENLPAIGTIKTWWERALSRGRRFVRQATVPPAFAMAVAEQQNPTRANSGFDLLLMRMEALGLELSEVRRIEAPVSHRLAAACTKCERKNQCEEDLAHFSAGMVNHDWETYCPNATILNAMSGLPWFRSYRRAASLAEA